MILGSTEKEERVGIKPLSFPPRHATKQTKRLINRFFVIWNLWGMASNPILSSSSSSSFSLQLSLFVPHVSAIWI